MKYKKEFKIFYVFLLIFSIYVIVILSNIAIPILYKYLMGLIYVLSPFIIGFFFAFLLHPLVDKVEEQGINRMLSVLLVFFIFIVLIFYLISNLIPIVFNQVTDLKDQLPQMYQSLHESVDAIWTRLDFVPVKYRFYMEDIENYTMKNIFKIRFNNNIMNSILSSFNIIVLTPIIIYYFLYDYNNLKLKLKKFLMRKKMKFLYHFLKEADDEVGAYFRGLVLVMNLMSIVSGLGFYLVGLKYPMLFGFIVGYTNAIPIIGNYIGGIPAVLFALTQSWKIAILSLVVIVIVQLIESNIVTPYVQSKSIDCHPLLILLAFVVFGKLFGFIGMIFAIPLLAIIMLIFKYMRIYLRLKKIRVKKIVYEKE